MEVSQCFALIQCDRTVSLSLALGMYFVRLIWINRDPQQVPVVGKQEEKAEWRCLITVVAKHEYQS